MKNIFEKKNGMTSTDLYLIDLINANFEKFIEYSMIEFSVEFLVSTSSLSRISKKLRFTNYSAMRIFASSNRKIESPIKVERKNIEEISLMSDLSQIYKKTIRLNESRSLEGEILKASKIMLDSEEVHLMGSGSSSLLASHFNISLNRLNIRSEIYTNIHDLIVKIAYANEKSVFVLFSKSLESKEVLFVIKEAKKTNSKIICFTTNHELNKMNVDVPIIINHVPQKNRLFSISSKVANLFIIDNILFKISSMHKNLKFREPFDKLIKKWNKK